MLLHILYLNVLSFPILFYFQFGYNYNFLKIQIPIHQIYLLQYLYISIHIITVCFSLVNYVFLCKQNFKKIILILGGPFT